MSWSDPTLRNTGDLITAAIWNQDVVDNVQHLHDNMAQHAHRFHYTSRVLVGSAIAIQNNTSQAHYHYSRQNPSANGDSFELACVLDEGTYTLNVLGATNTNCGMVNWTLDGVPLATGQDWYAATPANNVIMTTSNIVVASAGRHLLVGTINGKNGASSGYTLNLTAIWFTRSDETQGV